MSALAQLGTAKRRPCGRGQTTDESGGIAVQWAEYPWSSAAPVHGGT